MGERREARGRKGGTTASYPEANRSRSRSLRTEAKHSSRIFSVLMTFDRIVSSPDVLSGAPGINGTRISVSMILEWVASEANRSEILEAYPHLEPEDVEQALHYAARFMENEVVETTEIPE